MLFPPDISFTLINSFTKMLTLGEIENFPLNYIGCQFLVWNTSGVSE